MLKSFQKTWLLDQGLCPCTPLSSVPTTSTPVGLERIFSHSNLIMLHGSNVGQNSDWSTVSYSVRSTYLNITNWNWQSLSMFWFIFAALFLCGTALCTVNALVTFLSVFTNLHNICTAQTDEFLLMSLALMSKSLALTIRSGREICVLDSITDSWTFTFCKVMQQVLFQLLL